MKNRVLEKSPRIRKRLKFKLGHTIATISVIKICTENDFDLGELLDRHACGDWGDINEDLQEKNNISLENNGKLISIFNKKSFHIRIITEKNRETTMINLLLN